LVWGWVGKASPCCVPATIPASQMADFPVALILTSPRFHMDSGARHSPPLYKGSTLAFFLGCGFPPTCASPSHRSDPSCFAKDFLLPPFPPFFVVEDALFFSTTNGFSHFLSPVSPCNVFQRSAFPSKFSSAETFPPWTP